MKINAFKKGFIILVLFLLIIGMFEVSALNIEKNI